MLKRSSIATKRQIAKIAGYLMLNLCLSTTAKADPLSVDDCVQIALSRSAKIAEAEAKIQEYEAVLAEVEATYYPKLMGMAYVAPMFTVRGDHNQFHRAYDKMKHWGPYTHLQALLAQPLYTFGRAEAGERAASQRAEVERARLRETELAVALEVKRFYMLHLFAKSMLPTLRIAKEAVEEALEKGQGMYDQGGGGSHPSGSHEAYICSK